MAQLTASDMTHRRGPGGVESPSFLAVCLYCSGLLFSCLDFFIGVDQAQ